MGEVRWTEEALSWLEKIFFYIAQDKPLTAEKVVDGIYEKAKLLRQYPDLGYFYRSVDEGDVRILLYGHYRIAYLRRNDSRMIDILGVIHGAMEIDRFFQGY